MISVAVERNGYVYVYNENNRNIFSRKGELSGYTGNTVSIREGSYIYIYNEKGSKISSQYSK